MVNQSEIRYLLQDKISFGEYFNRKIPDYDTIVRRMMLLDRSMDTFIPDQYYRLNNIRTLEGIENLPQLLYKGIARLSGEYLETINKEDIPDFIGVKQSRFNEWQFLLADVPPLLLKMAYLADNKVLQNYGNRVDIMSYFDNYVLPNSHYSSLALPSIPEMEQWLQEKHGLNDLHIHLNGSTEFDLVWQFCLSFPLETHRYFAEKSETEYVKELCEQVGVDRKEISYYLQVAQRIRNLIFDVAINPTDYRDTNFNEVLAVLLCNENYVNHNAIQEYLAQSDPKYRHSEYMMSAEALLYVVVFFALRNSPNKHLAMLFHWYLLIMGRFNCLLVQQNKEKGFDQFQKVTLTDIRGRTEEQYKLLFKQLKGNSGDIFGHIEGRFAPKDSEDKNNSIVYRTVYDWESREFDDNSTLKLVAHFIKKEKNQEGYHRYLNFRSKLFKQAESFINSFNSESVFKQYVVGIDAAANEMFVPADVFAPDFRRIRRACHLPVTYHAGEDFYSLLGGIRAVYEAVYFLDMESGNRIGHACALGLDPKLWYECIDDSINVHQGYLLDNLVFAYYLIDKYKCLFLCKTKHRILKSIQNYCLKIYDKEYSVDDLIQAWKWRKYNSELAMADNIFDAQYKVTFDCDEYKEILKNINKNTKAYEAYCKFQTNACFIQYYDVVTVKPSDFFTCSEMKLIQGIVLRFMNKKGVVIEALPTSNIHIGYYKNYDNYHIWRWLKASRCLKLVPPIVLGTDDCGIFSTNIYNEYAHLFCNLVNIHHLSRTEALEIISKIHSASGIYKF